MKNKSIITGAIIIFVLSFQACTKDSYNTETDNSLFTEATTGNFTQYQNGNLLQAASASPHGSFRLRFNAVAQAALDSTGELPAGADFPSGALIVKDISEGTNVILYAVMKKDPGNTNAGEGWLWAEYNPDGSAIFSVGKKGVGCIGCHNDSPNRDLIRTFDSH